MPIKLEVWGDYACFTRPEMKVERVSYEVMTPSAARGILESIYWNPGMRYCIDKIHILHPVQYISICRNELKSTLFSSSMLTALKYGTPIANVASDDRQQRNSLILKDVHYVIEAHFELTPHRHPGNSEGQFQSTLVRRIKRGKYYSQPYLGCREYPAFFRLWEEEEIPAISMQKDLGWMLYDLDYSDAQNIKPIFFPAYVENGILDIGKCRGKHDYTGIEPLL